jgi:hypothetical protein
MKSLNGYFGVFAFLLTPESAPAVHRRGNQPGSNAGIGIENPVTLLRQRQNTALD